MDGLTWSTRRTELQQIKERQEAQRVTFPGGVPAKAPASEDDEYAGQEEEAEPAEEDKEEAEDDGKPVEIKMDDDDAIDEDEEETPRGRPSVEAKATPAKVRKIQAKKHTSVHPKRVEPKRSIERGKQKSAGKSERRGVKKTRLVQRPAKANKGTNNRLKKKAA